MQQFKNTYLYDFFFLFDNDQLEAFNILLEIMICVLSPVTGNGCIFIHCLYCINYLKWVHSHSTPMSCSKKLRKKKSAKFQFHYCHNNQNHYHLLFLSFNHYPLSNFIKLTHVNRKMFAAISFCVICAHRWFHKCLAIGFNQQAL